MDKDEVSNLLEKLKEIKTFYVVCKAFNFDGATFKVSNIARKKELINELIKINEVVIKVDFVTIKNINNTKSEEAVYINISDKEKFLELNDYFESKK